MTEYFTNCMLMYIIYVFFFPTPAPHSKQLLGKDLLLQAGTTSGSGGESGDGSEMRIAGSARKSGWNTLAEEEEEAVEIDLEGVELDEDLYNDDDDDGDGADDLGEFRGAAPPLHLHVGDDHGSRTVVVDIDGDPSPSPPSTSL
jgi:hypothetical protein